MVISDRIFIRCLNGSCRLPTEYSFGVCTGQVDYRLSICSVYEMVRHISDMILFLWMNGSGELCLVPLD